MSVVGLRLAIGVLTADLIVMPKVLTVCSHLKSSTNELSAPVMGAAVLGLRIAEPQYLSEFEKSRDLSTCVAAARLKRLPV